MNSVIALFSYTLSVSAIPSRAVSDSADSRRLSQTLAIDRCNLNSGTRNPFFVENSESTNRVLGGGVPLARDSAMRKKKTLKKSRNPFVGIFFFNCSTAISAGVTPRVEIARYTKISLVLPRIAVLATARSRSKAAGEVTSRECERDEKRLGRGEPHEPKGSVRIRGGTESGPS